MLMPDAGPPYVFGGDLHQGEGVTYRRFRCARCEESFLTTTTEEELNREFLASGQPVSTGIRSVCDDCYEYVMTIARQNGLLC